LAQKRQIQCDIFEGHLPPVPTRSRKMIRKNLKIICNAEDTSIEEYQGRFRCFTIYDFVLGALYGAKALGNVTGDDMSVWDINGDWGLLRIVTAVVSLLFFLDGVLFGRLSCSAIPSFNKGSTSSEQLVNTVNVNLLTNTLTFCTYVAMECYSLGDAPSSSGSGRLVGVVIIAFVLLSKAAKIGVIWAFWRKLSALATSSSSVV